MHILAAFRSPAARERARRHCEYWARITLIDALSAVEGTLQRTHVDAFIFELNPLRWSLESFAWRIRERYPSLPLIIYCPVSPGTAREILRLTKAGVDELIVEGQDDDRMSFRRVVVAAAFSRCTTRSLSAFAARLPAPSRAIVTRSLQLAREPLTVRDLANAVGVNRKTLVNRLSAADLPAPSTLIARCRVLLACELLQDAGRSVEQVALVLGFGSGVALRNMFRRHLGLRPSELRDPGSFDLVLGRLFGDSKEQAMT